MLTSRFKPTERFGAFMRGFLVAIISAICLLSAACHRGESDKGLLSGTWSAKCVQDPKGFRFNETFTIQNSKAFRRIEYFDVKNGSAMSYEHDRNADCSVPLRTEYYLGDLSASNLSEDTVKAHFN